MLDNLCITRAISGSAYNNTGAKMPHATVAMTSQNAHRLSRDIALSICRISQPFLPCQFVPCTPAATAG